MRCSRSAELIEPDSEIDRAFRRLLKERRDREKAMAEQNERKVLGITLFPLLLKPIHASLHR